MSWEKHKIDPDWFIENWYVLRQSLLINKLANIDNTHVSNLTFAEALVKAGKIPSATYGNYLDTYYDFLVLGAQRLHMFKFNKLEALFPPLPEGSEEADPAKWTFTYDCWNVTSRIKDLLSSGEDEVKYMRDYIDAINDMTRTAYQMHFKE